MTKARRGSRHLGSDVPSASDFRKARRRVPRPPHPPLRVDLSPEGEVGMWRGLALLYISLWERGRIAPASRVRGPFSDSRSRSDLANEGGGAHDGAGEAVMLALHQDHRAIAGGGQHFIEGQLQVGARLRVPHAENVPARHHLRIIQRAAGILAPAD